MLELRCIALGFAEYLLRVCRGQRCEPDQGLATDPCAHREQGETAGQDGPWLHQLCRGSELSLPAPPARVPSPAVQARLAKLRANLEAKNYAAMVHDITGTVRAATWRLQYYGKTRL